MQKNSLNRLIKDISEIYNNPLTDQNIYYSHDDSNMLKGYAMIIGSENTPYTHGFYLFEFDFPDNYPHEPPKLTFKTCDGYTRFNPNLYVSGKVCLSLLNTWPGESWSSCQTISSILLTLTTVLNNNPLLNEPGITRHSHKNNIHFYNKSIQFKNLEIAFYNMLNINNLNDNFKCFHKYILDYANENKTTILNDLEYYSVKFDKKIIIDVGLYSMHKIIVDYPTLYKKVLQFYQN